MDDKKTSFSEEYDTSISEINRRKKAFLALSISLFISTGISFFIFFFSFLHLVFIFIAILASVVLLAIISSFNFLERSKSIKIIISDQKIEKNWLDNIDKYDIKSIESIKIKRTTVNLIREIGFNISGGKPFYINGLVDFEGFHDNLLSVIDKKIQIHRVKEPLDYDHPWFYVFLGLFLGISSVLFLKILFIFSEFIWLFQLSTACLIILLGIYWLFNKPITGRYGQGKKTIDNLIGVLFIAIGFIILWLYTIYPI